MNIIDRRALLRGIGLGGIGLGGIGLGGMGLAAMSLPTAAGAKARRPFFARINTPVGLQIYTLGPDAGRDVDATFAAVAAIGYREIELPSLLGRQPAELAAAAARAGLAIRSVHVPLLRNGGPGGLTFGSDPALIADQLGALGARWAVAPILLMPEGFRPGTGETFQTALGRAVAASGEDIWKQSADILNHKASALKPLGIRVGYHNHNLEFAPIATGAGTTRGWDILWRETQPDLVSFEVDLGWVAAGGLDPATFLDQHRGRVRLLHVKDVARGTTTNYALSMQPAEVGSGTLDWARILPAAQRAGVEHYFVEQEPPFAIPRIEAAAKSFRFLSHLPA